MRMIRVAIPLIAIWGWALSAEAGSVTQKYSVSECFGASSTTRGGGLTYSARAVDGSLMVAVSTPNSTFTASVPPASASLHLSGGLLHATGERNGFRWNAQRTVSAIPQGSTQCHVGASGAIAASCSATFSVVSKLHCTGGRCDAALVPGCFSHQTASNTASVTHTQMWTAKSIHLGQGKVSNTHDFHYLKSIQLKLVPPSGQTCGGGSGPHKASSDTGFHTFHVGARQTQ